MSIIRVINVSFELWGSVLSLIVILSLILSRRTREKTDQLFIWLMFLNMTAMLFDAAALYFRGGVEGYAWFGVRFANFAQFVCATLESCVFIGYQKAYIEARTGRNIGMKMPRIINAAAIFTIGLMIINLFYPFLYQIDEQNLYSRLPGYCLIYIPNVVALGISLVWFSHKEFEIEAVERYILPLYILIPTLTTAFSVFSYGFIFGYFGSTLSLVIMYIFLQSEFGKKVSESEKEVLQSKLNLAVGQVHPHFLYNTLDTIGILCKTDSLLASEVIDNFTIYLRANLDGIQNQELIPIEKELSHVKAYLNIQKIRFDEDLQVTYEIEDSDIMLPPLTIQPVVENAIVHGMMGKEGVFHLSISTRREESAHRIEIRDDGCGFDIQDSPDTGRSHVGIKNVSNRVKMMADGTVTVDSAKGAGTCVTIVIP